MLMERNIVVYLPYARRRDKENPYLKEMIRILGKRYDVQGELSLDIRRILRTKALVLNWIETELTAFMRLCMLFYKLCGVKMIWVFHDRFPHDADRSDKRLIFNMKWLADKADGILLHSKSSARYIPNRRANAYKGRYAPIPIYKRNPSPLHVKQLREKYGIKDEDFVFTMYGLIRPYKHYEDGIKAFRELKLDGAKLILAGESRDKTYTCYLKECCGSDQNIILDIRYFPDSELDALLEISDVIVIPYVNYSSMNSAVMLQAFCNERTVIVPNICMAKDLASYRFFYRYKASLKKTMQKAYANGKEQNRQMGRSAYEYTMEHNSDAMVEEGLYDILEGKQGG